jgi:hypothetical protein
MLVTVVPEPSLYALALVGLACGGVAMRRRPRAVVMPRCLGWRPTARANPMAPARVRDRRRLHANW